MTLSAGVGRTHDAVIIVPGIMGSELYDTRCGRTIWGARSAGWYVRAWSTGSGLEDLQLTDAEQQGEYGRVRPVGLLRFPAFFRVLGGLEPYTKLVKTARTQVAHPDAVLEFAYDWRLPVRHNARLLAEAARRHLDAWRSRPAHQEARLRHPDQRPAQLVLVAHSMGGLLVRQMHTEFEPLGDIRATLTLGTPFYGAVNAVALLNSGQGSPIPLPARRPFTSVLRPDADRGLQRLVRDLPGVHDLLPTYRSLVEGPSEAMVRRLDAGDVEALGGSRELAAQSLAWQASLDEVTLRNHRAVIGVQQQTTQSFRLTDGIVTAEERIRAGQSAGEDRRGDGTVYRESAFLAGVPEIPVAQQHGSLARKDAVLDVVRYVLSEHDFDRIGPPLGGDDIGLTTPDAVTPGEEFTVEVTGAGDRSTCVVTDVVTGRQVDAAEPRKREDVFAAELRLPEPGLFRVRVEGGSGAAVERFVLVVDDA